MREHQILLGPYHELCHYHDVAGLVLLRVQRATDLGQFTERSD